MGILPEFLSSIIRRTELGKTSRVESIDGLPRPDVYRYVHGDQETAEEAFGRLDLDSIKRFGRHLTPRQREDLGQMRSVGEGNLTDAEKRRLRYPNGGGSGGRAA